MKKRASYLFAASIAVAGVGAASAGDVSAGTTDDQVAADAAIAAFSEDMLGAGAVSQGASDATSSTDEETAAADNPGLQCFGDFGAGLDAGGHVEGETARAFSDNFTMPAADEVPSTGPEYYPSGAEIHAAVVTLDVDHQDTLDQLVAFAGSDEAATCLEDAFESSMESERASADTTGGSEPPSYEIAVTAAPDIGIGDASAQFTLTLATTYQGATYGFITEVYVARVDRSIAVVIVTTDDVESTSDAVDPLDVLAALVNAL